MTTPRRETDRTPTDVHQGHGTGQDRNAEHGAHGMMMMFMMPGGHRHKSHPASPRRTPPGLRK
jgi:hypothetical protein